ncbi:hypothetical protein ED733_004913 [Metarhizium rileyi]|uniref:Uncharacterized protein n=1 Tax=Metarhizium rileyi (strain RCEF 4871) TaxID=1649241 RepID=A0A5C6G9G3_METRR|nr:hypothetical protein ED733_004913 [Metarhizium rileyi]
MLAVFISPLKITATNEASIDMGAFDEPLRGSFLSAFRPSGNILNMVAAVWLR